jgi:hypothetical protein
MSENGETKTLVVLTQEEIDTAIHGLEEVSVGMDDEFREVYGDTRYRLSKFYWINSYFSSKREIRVCLQKATAILPSTRMS